MATEQHTEPAEASETTVHEKYSNGPEYLNPNMDTAEAMRRIRTAGSISIPPELFEKLYLSPHDHYIKGDLRKTFGNPTPLALCGFLLSLSPLSCDLMGWRGTNAGIVGAAGIATYFFFGGLLMILGALGEWLIGNTFPFVAFGSFGAFWLSFAGTLQPWYGAWSAYATDPSNPTSGLDTVGFHSSFAFVFLAMALLCMVFTVMALRTNVAFVTIFFTLIIAFSCLSGAYWQTSNGNAALAGRLQKTAGAFTFISSACGWWTLVAIMLAAMDFPFQLPVGDLSRVIKSATQLKRERAGDSNV